MKCLLCHFDIFIQILSDMRTICNVMDFDLIFQQIDYANQLTTELVAGQMLALYFKED